MTCSVTVTILLFTELYTAIQYVVDARSVGTRVVEPLPDVPIEIGYCPSCPVVLGALEAFDEELYAYSVSATLLPFVFIVNVTFAPGSTDVDDADTDIDVGGTDVINVSSPVDDWYP